MKKLIILTILSLMLLICFYNFVCINYEDKYIGKQWYIKNDGVCEEISIDSEFCEIKEFKNGVDINIEAVWEKEFNNQNEVVVAIIDTGINFKHEDLKGVEWVNVNETANDGIDNDKNGYVDDINGWNFCGNNNNLLAGDDIYENDHGTMEAGIIAAKHNAIGIAGIAGNCNIKIMSIKVLAGITHEGSIDNLIQGIEYAEKMGAQICNLSLGLSKNNKELKKIMQQSSMLFVTSAGNEAVNLDKQKKYPASYKLSNQIAVTSIGFDGNLDVKANYGKNTVDIAAPGIYIFSTCVEGYDYDSGTSMAAAIISGIAAIIYSNQNDIQAYEVKKIICENVTLNKQCLETVKSGGYVNTKKIINAMMSN